MVQQLEPQRTTSYLRSLAIDETLGLTSPDGTFFLTADALGSTVAISDGAGSAVNEYTYDPFGTVTATNPAFANPFQFTGCEYDPQGRLSTVTDPAGGQTRYTYDTSDRILTITDPRSRSSRTPTTAMVV